MSTFYAGGEYPQGLLGVHRPLASSGTKFRLGRQSRHQAEALAGIRYVAAGAKGDGRLLAWFVERLCRWRMARLGYYPCPRCGYRATVDPRVECLLCSEPDHYL